MKVASFYSTKGSGYTRHLRFYSFALYTVYRVLSILQFYNCLHVGTVVIDTGNQGVITELSPQVINSTFVLVSSPCVKF